MKIGNKKSIFFFILFSITLAISHPQDIKIKIKEVLTIGNDDEGIIFQWVGLTTDDKNNIYITDLKDYSVKKFDAEGRFVKKTGKKGQGPGEFLTPGIIQFHDGHLFVGQIQHSGIQVFDTELNYIKSIPLKFPVTSFRVTGKDQLAVSRLMSNKIQVFNFKGEEVNSIQYTQDQDYVLNAVDFVMDNKNFYLCFEWQDIISKFSIKGRKIWENKILKINKVKRKKIGNFILPQNICFKSIAFDHKKNFIYVLGGDLSKNISRDIYVLSQDGKWVDTITLPEQTHIIHIDSDNFLYSRSEYGALIKKFKLISNE